MSKAKLMGILNVTPDSFYDGGRYNDPETAVTRGLQMIKEGADILDIGGESTRPGSFAVPEAEELARVIPVIKKLCTQTTCVVSVDTMKPGVAAAAIEAGASLINDVGGFSLPSMQEIAAAYDVDICVMHMQGEPRTMQNNPSYPEGVVAHLMHWFENRVNTLKKKGIKENRIILDPGIGFGKTVDDNLQIIQNLSLFKSMGFRVLLGASRKSFLSKIVNKTSADVLPETLAVHVIGLQQGVDIIRVHDVREHRGIIDLMERFA
ncbi:dihydropteroate synthase [Parachlamydia sp. AcF125]|uniref:dihydropteroate synthase n=1 Tax=Parachlamydia sp. AcF125 TaxID=2795736 RepID=UPI001BC8D11A|nr:dihydropteroate synthase [Parachlamydia sp. AcF125]MBS4169214.1 Dihydropteroate synthase [Parachlamydia sp. AcF125]